MTLTTELETFASQRIDDIYRYHLARSGDPEAARQLTAATFAEYQAAADPALPASARLAQTAASNLKNAVRRGFAGPAVAAYEARGALPTGVFKEETLQLMEAERISRALRQMPPSQAEAVALHFFGAFDLLEIGLALGRREEDARRLLRRGMLELHARLLGQPARQTQEDSAFGGELRALAEALRPPPEWKTALIADLRGLGGAPRPFRRSGRQRCLVLAIVMTGVLLVAGLLAAAWLARGQALFNTAPVVEYPDVAPAREDLPDGVVERLGHGQARALLADAGEHLLVGSTAEVCFYIADIHPRWCQWTGSPVEQLAFSPDRQRIAAGLANGAVVIIRAEDGSTLLARSFGAFPVTGLEWLQGRPGLIAAATLDGTVTAWNPDTDEIAWGPERAGGVVRSMDSAGGDRPVLALASGGGMLVLDGQSGLEIHYEGLPRAKATAVQFSRDGEWLATAMEGAEDDSYVVIWRLSNWRQERRWNLVAPVDAILSGEAGMWVLVDGINRLYAGKQDQEGLELLDPMWSASDSPVAISPEGMLYYIADNMGYICRYNMERNETLLGIGAGYLGLLNGLSWLNSGSLQGIYGMRTIAAWNAQVGSLEFPEEIRPLDNENGWGTPFKAAGSSGAPLRAELHPDGRWLAVFIDEGVILVDVRNQTETARLPAGPDGFVQVAFSPDGTRVVTVDRLGGMTVWDARSGQPVNALDGLTASSSATSLAWLPDGSGGTTLAVGWLLVARMSLDLVDPTSGHITRLPGVDAAPSHLAYTPDGRFLAGAMESQVGVWDLRERRQLWKTERAPEKGRISAVAVSADGRFVATAAARLIVWDLQTGAQARQFDLPDIPLVSLAFSPDSRFLAGGLSGGTVLLWLASETP